MSEPFKYGNDPSLVLELASSIARRDIQEQYWQESILGETVPLAPKPPVEIATGIQTGATVAMLELLERPDATVDPTALIRTVIDDQIIVDMVRSSGEEPDEENTSYLRKMVDGQVISMWEHFASDHDAQQKLKDLLAVAESISIKHSVPIHKVFSDDELYAECIRALNTPYTYAEEATAGLEKINQEFLQAGLENMVEAMLQVEIDSGRLTAEEYTIEKAEMMEELLEDTELWANLNATLAEIRKAGQRQILRGIERFWGRQAVDEYTLSIGQLATELVDRTPLPDGLRKQQQYNDLVATICMEEGWDPDNLTVDQMRYINSSPQMQDFENGA